MMNAYFSSLGALDLVFFSLAAVGASLLLFRAVLMLAGMGHHDVDLSGADGHLDAHFDHDGDAHAGADSDAGFRLFSLQTLTAFFLIAGLAGLAFHRGSHLGETVSVLGALAAGVVMMLLIAWILSAVRRLQTSGTINLHSAIGEEGTVYLTIPKGGTGQAQLCVQNRLRICDAVAEPPAEIKTGDHVEVIDVVDDRMLVVRKVGAAAGGPHFWNQSIKE